MINYQIHLRRFRLKNTKIVNSECLLRLGVVRVCFCTGYFVMVPTNLIFLHCVQHSVFTSLQFILNCDTIKVKLLNLYPYPLCFAFQEVVASECRFVNWTYWGLPPLLLVSFWQTVVLHSNRNVSWNIHK